MKTINITLPQEMQLLKLEIFADLHLGDPLCDVKSIQERIEAVAAEPNAYCILNGDLLNNATKTSVSDTYGEVLSPMQQVAKAVELFSPIKDKILAVTTGNHELRTYRKEGIDLMEVFAREMGLRDRFSQGAALIFLRFGSNQRYRSRDRRMVYTIYTLHGSGGGRKAGAKINRLEEMAGIVDADIYIHSHTHLPAAMKQSFHRTSPANSSVALVDKLFVNTAASLGYGGYGEQQEYKPASMCSPVIYLDGTERNMTARV